MDHYHDLYPKSDVFKNFQSTCFSYYSLNPCHYFASTGISWDVVLKMTNIQLELISDIDQHLFIKKGLTGDISYISNRHATANNQYIKNYKKKPRKHIVYPDANNLYGRAMSQCPPTGDF